MRQVDQQVEGSPWEDGDPAEVHDDRREQQALTALDASSNQERGDNNASSLDPPHA